MDKYIYQIYIKFTLSNSPFAVKYLPTYIFPMLKIKTNYIYKYNYYKILLPIVSGESFALYCTVSLKYS